MNIRLSLRFSTRKFYEIINQKDNNLQVIPQIPQNAILSKYLSLKQESKNSEKKIGLAKWEKQIQKKLDYTQLLNGNPHGSIITFTHRNHQITLLSTNYFRIDEKKLHKVFYSAKPDAILVQRRPQYHRRNFNLFPKGPDGIFSDNQFLKQINFTSTDTQPPEKSLRPLINALNQANNEQLEQNPSKEVLQQKGLQICNKYSSAYKIPMYFGEMPMRTYRQWIANTHTLMQLQQIFKVVCQRLPRYRTLSFTPYQMATLIHPEIFLKINDNYMATIIQMLISTKKYKRIFGLFGIIQNQAVKYMLQKNQALNPIIQYLVPLGPKGSIIRDIQNLQIIQKQILLDVMFFGSQVSELKAKFFHTTNAIIAKYGKDVDKKTVMQFRYDKTTQYLKLMEQKIKQGQQEIKKQFVRETLRKNN